MSEDQKLGATGEFPLGKLNESDEGELRFSVSFNDDGLIIVEFGKPISWIGLPGDTAIEFAELLLKAATRARARKGEKPNG